MSDFEFNQYTDILLAMNWVIRPVPSEDGSIQLFDIFDPIGQWRGSRRTARDCRVSITQMRQGLDPVGYPEMEIISQK